MDFYDVTELFLLNDGFNVKAPAAGKYAQINWRGHLILPVQFFRDVEALCVGEVTGGGFVAKDVKLGTPGSTAVIRAMNQSTHTTLGVLHRGEKKRFTVTSLGGGYYKFTPVNPPEPVIIDANDIKKQIHSYDPKRYLGISKGNTSFRISTTFARELAGMADNLSGMYCPTSKILRLVPTFHDVPSLFVFNDGPGKWSRIAVRNNLVLDGLTGGRITARHRIPIVASTDGSYYAAAHDNPFWQDIGLSRDMGIGL